MRLTQEYQKNILFYLEKVNNIQITERFKALQQWQAQRLLNTHLSLYEQPRFQPAMNFFKDELYSAECFHGRNRQLIRATPLMCNTMPESMLDIVLQAAELHSLSLSLDRELLSNLPEHVDVRNLDLDSWVLAYQKCGNQDDRIQQINLIESLGNGLASLVKKPLIHSLLKWARFPAIMAGYEEIHHFVVAGFDAFEHLENADDFLIPVITTERTLSHQWFSKN